MKSIQRKVTKMGRGLKGKLQSGVAEDAWSVQPEVCSDWGDTSLQLQLPCEVKKKGRHWSLLFGDSPEGMARNCVTGGLDWILEKVLLPEGVWALAPQGCSHSNSLTELNNHLDNALSHVIWLLWMVLWRARSQTWWSLWVSSNSYSVIFLAYFTWEREIAFQQISEDYQTELQLQKVFFSRTTMVIVEKLTWYKIEMYMAFVEHLHMDKIS